MPLGYISFLSNAAAKSDGRSQTCMQIDYKENEYIASIIHSVTGLVYVGGKKKGYTKNISMY